MLRRRVFCSIPFDVLRGGIVRGLVVKLPRLLALASRRDLSIDRLYLSLSEVAIEGDPQVKPVWRVTLMVNQQE